MRWTGIYLIGYIIMLGGIIAALWKSGFLERIGAAWTIIGVVIAIGIGNGVNKSELDKITAATGGGAFVTADPSQIGDIFLKAISLRPGAAK